MSETLAELLDEAADLSIGSSARNRIEARILEETEVVTFSQLATLCDVLAHRTAVETEQKGDPYSAAGLLANAQTISEALRKLHEMIQTMA